jgi:Antibiotic biosynthesis monooxygenase
MSSPVVLNVHIEAAPGTEDELVQRLLALVAPTRAEPGCISYELFRDPERPAKFMFRQARSGAVGPGDALAEHLLAWDRWIIGGRRAFELENRAHEGDTRTPGYLRAELGDPVTREGRQMSLPNWERVMAVNLIGMFLCARSSVQALI